MTFTAFFPPLLLRKTDSAFQEWRWCSLEKNPAYPRSHNFCSIRIIVRHNPRPSAISTTYMHQVDKLYTRRSYCTPERPYGQTTYLPIYAVLCLASNVARLNAITLKRFSYHQNAMRCKEKVIFDNSSTTPICRVTSILVVASLLQVSNHHIIELAFTYLRPPKDLCPFHAHNMSSRSSKTDSFPQGLWSNVRQSFVADLIAPQLYTTR